MRKNTKGSRPGPQDKRELGKANLEHKGPGKPSVITRAGQVAAAVGNLCGEGGTPSRVPVSQAFVSGLRLHPPGHGSGRRSFPLWQTACLSAYVRPGKAGEPEEEGCRWMPWGF